jgi:hypothetical protein
VGAKDSKDIKDSKDCKDIKDTTKLGCFVLDVLAVL